MKIQPIDNQTSFGVRYVNKQNWYIYAVDAVKRSNIVKEINKKYPKAKIDFGEKDFGNLNNKSYIYSLTISLDRESAYSISKYDRNPFKALDSILNKLKYLTLENMEKETSPSQISPGDLSFTRHKGGAVKLL